MTSYIANASDCKIYVRYDGYVNMRQKSKKGTAIALEDPTTRVVQDSNSHHVINVSSPTSLSRSVTMDDLLRELGITLMKTLTSSCSELEQHGFVAVGPKDRKRLDKNVYVSVVADGGHVVALKHRLDPKRSVIVTPALGLVDEMKKMPWTSEDGDVFKLQQGKLPVRYVSQPSLLDVSLSSPPYSSQYLQGISGEIRYTPSPNSNWALQPQEREFVYPSVDEYMNINPHHSYESLTVTESAPTRTPSQYSDPEPVYAAVSRRDPQWAPSPPPRPW